ncbi:flavodoxin family protein [Chloroflexota bacterium]
MNINLLGICGSPTANSNTEVFLRESLEAARSSGDVKAKLVTLAGKEISECRNCNWCVTKQTEGNFCTQQDDMAGIYPLLAEADALLLASPVYMGRLNGHLACFLDRLRAFIYGNIYGKRMKNRVGSALAVAWGRNLGIETTLISIATTFLTLEMVFVGPPFGIGSQFGATGLVSEQGTGRFYHGERHGIQHDEHGIKGARALGKRVAEVAAMMKSGRNSVDPG